MQLIAEMGQRAHNPESQAQACSQLTSLVRGAKGQQPAAQAAIVQAGGDVLAMQAMESFPKDHPRLQVECAQLLGSLAHWNLDMATKVGRNGAIEAIAEAQRNYPDEWAIGVAAKGFTDWPDRSGSEANLASVQHSGLVDMVLDNLDTHYSEPQAVLQSLLFLSNACRSRVLKAKMAHRGYLAKSVQIMKDFPDYDGMRGQVAWISSECFMEPEWVQQQVELGVIPEMIRMMKDSGTRKLDVLGNGRAVKSSIAVLRHAAESGEHVDTIAQAGAIALLVDVTREQEFKPDIVVEACRLAQRLAMAQWAIPAVMNHQLRCDFIGSPGHQMQGPFVPANAPWAH